MKKYRIHFIYLLIIGALAVTSRLKTNDLEEQVQKANELAEMNAEEAKRQASYAAQAASHAEEQARLAREMLERCENSK